MILKENQDSEPKDKDKDKDKDKNKDKKAIKLVTMGDHLKFS